MFTRKNLYVVSDLLSFVSKVIEKKREALRVECQQLVMMVAMSKSKQRC